MAISVLFFHGQLCEATGFAIGNEDRVIAKAVLAGGSFEDMAFAGPFEELLAVIPDEGDDGAEAGAAVGVVAQPEEEEGDVVGVGALGAREAGA
jgi:hypothetical protein